MPCPALPYLVEVDEGLRAGEKASQVLPQVGQKPRVGFPAQLSGPETAERGSERESQIHEKLLDNMSSLDKLRPSACTLDTATTITTDTTSGSDSSSSSSAEHPTRKTKTKIPQEPSSTTYWKITNVLL